jgi:glyoxalase family protein
LDNEIDLWVDKLVEAGFKPTDIKNRKYFKSIYFREKGGLLIELATLGPGMNVDEAIETMGTQLIIPDHYKDDDHSHLMPIQVREVSELKGYGYRDKYEYELLQEKEHIKNQIKKLKLKPQLTTLEQSTLEDLKQQYLQKGAKQNDNKTTSI